MTQGVVYLGFCFMDTGKECVFLYFGPLLTDVNKGLLISAVLEFFFTLANFLYVSPVIATGVLDNQLWHWICLSVLSGLSAFVSYLLYFWF
jgi:hypothetical protein